MEGQNHKKKVTWKEWSKEPSAWSARDSPAGASWAAHDSSAGAAWAAHDASTACDPPASAAWDADAPPPPPPPAGGAWVAPDPEAPLEDWQERTANGIVCIPCNRCCNGIHESSAGHKSRLVYWLWRRRSQDTEYPPPTQPWLAWVCETPDGGGKYLRCLLCDKWVQDFDHSNGDFNTAEYSGNHGNLGRGNQKDHGRKLENFSWYQADIEQQRAKYHPLEGSTAYRWQGSTEATVEGRTAYRWQGSTETTETLRQGVASSQRGRDSGSWPASAAPWAQAGAAGAGGACGPAGDDPWAGGRDPWAASAAKRLAAEARTPDQAVASNCGPEAKAADHMCDAWSSFRMSYADWQAERAGTADPAKHVVLADEPDPEAEIEDWVQVMPLEEQSPLKQPQVSALPAPSPLQRPTVPPGWEAWWDEKSKKWYYEDMATTATTWTHPEEEQEC